MEILDKIIRKFKDTKGNRYEIRKKANNHIYLIEFLKNERFGKIINGSQIYIFNYLKEKHKNNKFIEM